MRAFVLAALLGVYAFVFVVPPVAAHNPDCFLTSHTVTDVHYDCTASRDEQKHKEWCVLSVDTGPDDARIMCDTRNSNGNPFR